MSVKNYYPNQHIRDEDGTLIVGVMTRRTLRQSAITVGVAATKIPTSPLSKRMTILIINVGTAGDPIYIGDSTVTAATGFPIYPRASMRIDIEDSVDIYGIAAVATVARILEGG